MFFNSVAIKCWSVLFRAIKEGTKKGTKMKQQIVQNNLEAINGYYCGRTANPKEIVIFPATDGTISVENVKTTYSPAVFTTTDGLASFIAKLGSDNLAVIKRSDIEAGIRSAVTKKATLTGLPFGLKKANGIIELYNVGNDTATEKNNKELCTTGSAR